MNGLLFSLPGTPVIYYGDEIGMGDNIYLGDRNGVRTPMQWSADRNAGFSRANPQKLYLPVSSILNTTTKRVNVETQQNNPHSLLWWMKRMLAHRKQHPAFGRGTLECFFRTTARSWPSSASSEDEKILVVANLSRFTQFVQLDLAKHSGSVPIEVFGRSRFPSVTDQPYALSLGPHSFQWFHLQPREPSQEAMALPGADRLPVISASLDDLFSIDTRRALSRILARVLSTRAWFPKNRIIRQVVIDDVVPLPDTKVNIVMIHVDFSDGEPENYVGPLSLETGEKAETMIRKSQFVLCLVQGVDPGTAILYGGVFDKT